MTVILKTLDQVPGAGTTEGPELPFETRQVTAREIVRLRVRAEVDRYNSNQELTGLTGWVTPTEHGLNGARRRPPPLDAERQVEVALTAIRKRRVVLMFNGVQVEDIDAPLTLTPVSEARFLRLVPLAGG